MDRYITKIDTEYLKVQNIRADGGTVKWIVECEVFRGKPGGAPPLKLRKNGTITLDVAVFLNGKYRLVKDAR